jgi:hypothetical protein
MNNELKDKLIDFIDQLTTTYGDDIVGFEVNLKRPVLKDEKKRQGFHDIDEFILKYITIEKIEL